MLTDPVLFINVHHYTLVPGDPRRVRVEAINSTAVFIEWRHPSSKERNGIIRGYQIQYIEINDDDIPTSNVRMADTMDGEKTEYVINQLGARDTKYQFTVAGYTRKGDGIRSKPKIVETKGAGNCFWLFFKFIIHSIRIKIFKLYLSSLLSFYFKACDTVASIYKCVGMFVFIYIYI